MNKLSLRTIDGSVVKRILTQIIASLGLALILLLLSTQEAYSQELSPNMGLFEREEMRVLTTSDQKLFRYKINYYVNQHGENAVEVSLIEAHWLAKDSSLVVLRGRDTDSDHVIDAWFYSDGAIIKSIRRVATSDDVWPTARSIVLEFSLDEPRWLATLVGKELLRNLFITIQGEIETTQELEYTQIDLLDLDYKIADLQASGKDPLLLIELRRVSKEGWLRLLNRWTKTQVEERHKRIMGDLALFVGNGIVFRGVKFLAVKALNSSTVTSMKTYFRTAIEEQKLWKKGVISKAEATEQAGTKSSTSFFSRGADIVGHIGSKTAVRFATEKQAIDWLSRTSIFSRALKKIGTTIKDVGTASWDRKGYIATAQTVQLAIESYMRGYWNFSDVPLVLDHPVRSTQEFVSQVANDKGLLQNLSYMTLQTTLLSGTSEALTRRNANLGVKYAVCSLITLIDSATVNVLVQGKSDITRISFDTAWELLIGGSQVHLDLKMLRWTGDLAERFHNPKLRLVGYLLGSVDQAVGYAAYNKASTTFFEAKPEDSGKASISLPPVVVVPVFAPALP